MTTRPAPDTLDTLAAHADAEARAQQARLDAALQESAMQRGRSTRFMAGALLLVFSAALLLQWPRINAPYGVPDAASPAVAEADLLAIAGFLEVFQVANGRLPDTLLELNMPGALRELVSGARVEYTRNGDEFLLSRELGAVHLSFDSLAGPNATQKQR